LIKRPRRVDERSRDKLRLVRRRLPDLGAADGQEVPSDFEADAVAEPTGVGQGDLTNTEPRAVVGVKIFQAEGFAVVGDRGVNGGDHGIVIDCHDLAFGLRLTDGNGLGDRQGREADLTGGSHDLEIGPLPEMLASVLRTDGASRQLLAAKQADACVEGDDGRRLGANNTPHTGTGWIATPRWHLPG
jgi:hypothetical protein